MTYAIVGFGSIGKALAKAFARKNIELVVASTQAPEKIQSEATKIGTKIIAKRVNEAIKANIIFLAVPFTTHKEVSSLLPSWEGKIIVDVTNAYGIPPSQLNNQPSSKVIETAFKGAKFVKGFNHLPAATLAKDPRVGENGKRVIFLSSENKEAIEQISQLASQLGFAPINLGGISEGGLLVQARGNVWGHLIFKDLVKFD